MFPFIPWLFILVGLGIQFIFQLSNKWSVYFLIAFTGFMGFYIRNIIEGTWDKKNSQVNMDLYKYQDQLKTIVPNDKRVIILNDMSNVMFPYIIDKQGNVFSKDDLPIAYIHDMIKRQGIEYMYSDSEKLNQLDTFQTYIDTLLLKAGTVNVYKLKLPD
jgi:hypothetical protein